MLQVVKELSTVGPDGRTGRVVLESGLADLPRAIDELSAPEARQYALQYARTELALADASQNGNIVHPYPINSRGEPIGPSLTDEHGNPLPPQNPRMQPFRYRIEVPVCARVFF